MDVTDNDIDTDNQLGCWNIQGINMKEKQCCKSYINQQYINIAVLSEIE